MNDNQSFTYLSRWFSKNSCTTILNQIAQDYPNLCDCGVIRGGNGRGFRIIVMSERLDVINEIANMISNSTLV